MSGWVKIHQVYHVIFETKSQSILHHSLVLWETNLLYFLSWNFISFGEKESVKVQNFRILTAHVKFHQICTLISSFCWKYIKFQLKEYRKVMSHDTGEWCKTWRITDSFFQDWQEFGEFQISDFTKIFTLIGSFSIKYIMFDLNKYKRVMSHDTAKWCKIWRKTDCGLENDMKNMANFHRSKAESVWA